MPGWRVSDLEKEVVPMALDCWGWSPAVNPLLEFWVFSHPIEPGFYLFVGHFLAALAESRCYSPVAPSLRHGAAIVWAWLTPDTLSSLALRQKTAAQYGAEMFIGFA